VFHLITLSFLINIEYMCVFVNTDLRIGCFGDNETERLAYDIISAQYLMSIQKISEKSPRIPKNLLDSRKNADTIEGTLKYDTTYALLGNKHT
tara:strand:+ start:982 stop:1260 length:279 start_codon:yes stop_codon:yes gene_type:complete